MKRNWIVGIAMGVAVVSIVLNNPYNILAPSPLAGSLDDLHSSQLFSLTGAAAVGPESLVFDPNGGGPYTGVSDGRILKWHAHSRSWPDFAFTSSNRKECIRPFAPEMEHVCGRPLGLRFDKKTGDLYIADAYLGLQVVGSEGGLATPVVSEVEGRTLRFTNDLDIDEDEDVIYFSDTSKVFQRRQFVAAILSADQTALSKDRTFVLVAETTTCQISRHWLRGPNAGKTDIFAKLPGFPDNIRRNSRGEFWVALHSKKGIFAKLALSHSSVGKTMLKLPLSMKQLHSLLVGGKAHATAIKLNEDGEVMEILEDSDGKTLKFISEVEEKDGKLWIGSVLMPFIGVYNL
ncbi:Protein STRICTOSIDINE SYNTHASE-LIKE 10 [Euphorbia peplus]|nr:Protein STRICTOSIDINE SYNTHASE-LIKE 10 [Euphorbia peplus]